MAEKKYEVTSVESGRTKIMTLRECNKMFGKDEFKEILAGYLPHIVAVEIKDEA